LQKLGKHEEETMLVQSQAEILKTSLIASWNANQSFYSYRDRETGLSQRAKSSPGKKVMATCVLRQSLG
jgi:hypothetical protein